MSEPVRSNSAEELAICECGHGALLHGVSEPGCAGRCLCEACPDDTINDCWCAGFRSAVQP